MFNICRKVSQKILPHSLKVFVRGSNVEREIKSIPVLDHRSKAIAVLDFRPKTLAVLDHSPKTIAETIAVRDQHPEKKTNHVKVCTYPLYIICIVIISIFFLVFMN